MKRGLVDRAERIALTDLDEWVECTGIVEMDCGYYYELQGNVIDSVHIGIQMAIFGNVLRDEHGQIIKTRFEE